MNPSDNNPKPKSFVIKDWAEDDRPREKLMAKGREALSNAELLAILIGSGSATQSAVDLCKDILTKANNNLNMLAKYNLSDLMQFKGIGEAKAISIMAALELGRRRQLATALEKVQIKSSHTVYEILQPKLADLPHEEFWMISLNRANKVIDYFRISVGGISGTVADVRLILKTAIEKLASGIIVAHNHPSGNLQPSQADKDLTNRLKEACKLVEIQLFDHLIITESSYFSFADEGLL